MNDYWFRSTPDEPIKRESKDEPMRGGGGGGGGGGAVGGGGGEGYPITDNAAWLMKWMARHGFGLTLGALAELAHRMDELRDGAQQQK